MKFNFEIEVKEMKNAETEANKVIWDGGTKWMLVVFCYLCGENKTIEKLFFLSDFIRFRFFRQDSILSFQLFFVFLFPFSNSSTTRFVHLAVLAHSSFGSYSGECTSQIHLRQSKRRKAKRMNRKRIVFIFLLIIPFSNRIRSPRHAQH